MTLNLPMEIGSTRIRIGVSFLTSGAEHPASTDITNTIESPTGMVALLGESDIVGWQDAAPAMLGLWSQAMAVATTNRPINFDIGASRTTN